MKAINKWKTGKKEKIEVNIVGWNVVPGTKREIYAEVCEAPLSELLDEYNRISNKWRIFRSYEDAIVLRKIKETLDQMTLTFHIL
jgi:hypothetical protein